MPKEINIIELVNMLKGRAVGNFSNEIRITGTCAVDRYVENKVSFVRNRKYGEMLAQLQNAVILVPEDLIEFCQRYPQNVYIVVRGEMNSLMDIQDFFYADQ